MFESVSQQRPKLLPTTVTRYRPCSNFACMSKSNLAQNVCRLNNPPPPVRISEHISFRVFQEEMVITPVTRRQRRRRPYSRFGSRGQQPSRPGISYFRRLTRGYSLFISASAMMDLARKWRNPQLTHSPVAVLFLFFWVVYNKLVVIWPRSSSSLLVSSSSDTTRRISPTFPNTFEWPSPPAPATPISALPSSH